MADESVCIGPPPAKDSYLNIPSILAACEITGADAVHPGYGFLSENARFARILSEHKITFIGPSEHHIQIMGDKITAKKTAVELGIPVVPGSDGEVKTPEEAQAVAKKIGYPVIVKATAGGGGRGMKVAQQRRGDVDRHLDGAHRSQGRLRQRLRLHRKIPAEAAPHRNPGDGRRPGQRGPSRHPRLLAAAPPPEGLGRSDRADGFGRAARPRSAKSAPPRCASSNTRAPARSSSSTRTASSTSSR